MFWFFMVPYSRCRFSVLDLKVRRRGRGDAEGRRGSWFLLRLNTRWCVAPFELAAWPGGVQLETESEETHLSVIGGEQFLVGLGQGGGLAGKFWEAVFVEGALGALGLEDGGRSELGLE